MLTTGSIERTVRDVAIYFKMCCLYVVLVLPGSVETQLVWSGIFKLLCKVILPLSTGAKSIFRRGHPQQERQIEVGYTKNLRFSTSISEIPIPIPNTEPTWKNTDENTEYRYRLQIPIPTQLYSILHSLSHSVVLSMVLCTLCYDWHYEWRHVNVCQNNQIYETTQINIKYWHIILTK